MKRNDGRTADDCRALEITTGFHRNAEGSVLYRAGGTLVLCTASMDDSVPKWMDDNKGGWLTAEYQMHPRANPARRENRDGRGRQLGGRTMEIQRLIGRSLRAAMDLKALGARTITIDCDILEADGGTRTASITAGFIAAALALHNRGLARVLAFQVAAISVGHVAGKTLVDLDYSEDSRARVDMNVVATVDGDLVEVQSTSEGSPIKRAEFDRLLAGGLSAIESLCAEQVKALQGAGADLNILMKKH